MPKLIYKDPDTGSQVVVDIDEEMSEVTVGRNPGNIIRINNPSVSRRHTKFVYEHGQVTLYDLNSSNGTYVNGMRIQNQVLEDGDLVRVGEFPLEFVDDVDASNTQVDDGHVAEAYTDSEIKSTHLGVGAMEGDDTGRGGAMAPAAAQRDDDSAPLHTGTAKPGAVGEPEEIVLDEEDIEEVMDPDPFDSAVQQDDDTVEASLDSLTGLQQEELTEALSEPEGDAKGDDDTRRADGDALVSQLQDAAFGREEDAESDPDVKRLRSQVDELRAELEKAPDRQNFEQVRSERDELAERVDELEARLEERDEQLDAARRRGDRGDEEIGRLQDSIAELEDETDAKDEQIDRLEQQLQQLEQNAGGGEQQRIEALQEQLDEKDDRIDQLEQQLEAVESGPAGDEQLQQQRQELQQLREQVAAFDQEREEKKAIFAELSSDLRELVGQNKELNAEVQRLEQQLQTVTDERDALLETIDDIEEGAAPADAAGAGSGEGMPEDYEQILEEKQSLEETLAEVILERDRLEDQLREERDAS